MIDLVLAILAVPLAVAATILPRGYFLRRQRRSRELERARPATVPSSSSPHATPPAG